MHIPCKWAMGGGGGGGELLEALNNDCKLRTCTSAAKLRMIIYSHMTFNKSVQCSQLHHMTRLCVHAHSSIND